MTTASSAFESFLKGAWPAYTGQGIDITISRHTWFGCHHGEQQQAFCRGESASMQQGLTAQETNQYSVEINCKESNIK